jgi:hypothetical protein
VASNDRRCPSSRPQLPDSHFSQRQLSADSTDKSESKLFYDRRSVGQFVLVSSPAWSTRSDFCYCQTFAGLLVWGFLFDEKTGLSFIIVAGPRQRNHSRIWVPWNHDHILLSQVSDSPNLVGQVPVFISPRNRVVQLYPQALGSIFIASHDSQGCGGDMRIHFHFGDSTDRVESSRVLCYDRRSVGQSVLVSSTHLGLTTRFLLLLDSYGFADVGRSLWREKGCRLQLLLALASAIFSGPSPVGLATIF